VRRRGQILPSFEAKSWVTDPPVLLAPLIYVGHWVVTSLRAFWLGHVGLWQVAATLRHITMQSYVENARAIRRRMLAEVTSRSVVWWRRFHLVVTVGMFAVAMTHIVLGLLYKAH
jgi:hypothetical protein